MHDTSARLVERVLPAASYRHWVLTVPFPLRLRIARDPGELGRVLNLFHRALRAELRRRARRLGLPVGEPAAVTFVQRFGGALNLHVHFHAIVAEALFAKDGDAVQRIDLPQPSDEDVRCVLARLVRKLHRARTPGVEEPAPVALVGSAAAWALGSTWSHCLVLPRGLISSAAQMLCGGLLLLAFALVSGERSAQGLSSRSLKPSPESRRSPTRRDRIDRG